MIVQEFLTLLGFKVDDKGLDKLDKKLGHMRASLGGIRQMAGRALGGLAVLAGGLGVKELAQANIEYENLTARLKTLEGSPEAAQKSFASLQKFAAETPFQLTEVVAAYADLKAAGFDASDANMRALGDLASSSQKPLGMVVEAMKKASIGQSAMLDNFTSGGITAKSVKGQVQASSRVAGITKKTLKDQKDIMSFMTQVGKAKGVGGAMTEKMKTIGGAISNLKDNVFKFYTAVGAGGDLRGAFAELVREIAGAAQDGAPAARVLGEMLAGGVRKLTKVVRWLKKHMSKLKPVLAAVFGLFIGAKVASGVGIITSAVKFLLTTFGGFLPALKMVGVFLLEAFAPALLIGGALTTLGLIVDDLRVYFNGGKSAIGALINKFKEAPGPLGDIARAVETLLAEVGPLFGQLKTEFTKAFKSMGPELAEIGRQAKELGVLLLPVFKVMAGLAVLATLGWIKSMIQQFKLLINAIEPAAAILKTLLQLATAPLKNIQAIAGFVGNGEQGLRFNSGLPLGQALASGAGGAKGAQVQNTNNAKVTINQQFSNTDPATVQGAAQQGAQKGVSTTPSLSLS